MDFPALLLLLTITVALALLANVAQSTVKSSKEMLTHVVGLHCPPHKWKWTEPGKAKLEVLKCSTCGFIAGPVDENGNPNPEYNKPRGE